MHKTLALFMYILTILGIIFILPLTNMPNCDIIKPSDREVPYQALLFENDRLELDEWGVIDMVLFQCNKCTVLHPMPYASEKHYLIRTILYPIKCIHLAHRVAIQDS